MSRHVVHADLARSQVSDQELHWIFRRLQRKQKDGDQPHSPQDNNPTDGLKFQVYSLRLQEQFGLSYENALAILPSCGEPWIYYETAGPDYEGFEGYFAADEEVDLFIGKLGGVAGSR